MNGFTESRITLNFPTKDWFRFQDCKEFKNISGYSFKEMDACWLDRSKHIFYLIELKDFTEASLEDKESSKTRGWNLIKKSVDCLQMLNAALMETGKGTALNAELSDIIKDGYIFKFISIIKIAESQKSYLPALNDFYRSNFKAYSDLFGINYYSVISYEGAKKYFPDFVF